ncbi:FAD-dependent monooxygenase [Geomonas sp. RF6]|uniref:FAD-dependent oxidoreductase n=1 Tax=Geomonas sp. RF6 TaxID=2897342 RepID=UPI001E4012C6|nr:FAD-dependent monooxygenase [Geomonas sp. RF6]UFS71957.1 FAD-dependent monooxygenase [Geomonas sp. RF6]
MSNHDQPLIVGAGPVGLAAALFLARQGIVPRVVEMRHAPAPHSRGMAVNPRTLEILEHTGISRQMLELGLPIRGVLFHRHHRKFAELSLAGIHPHYPFMLALSQASTERLLARALDRAGVAVERGLKMIDCRPDEDGVAVVLEPSGGGMLKAIECPWILAADGAHSTAREKLKLDFGGSTLGEEWYLADVQLRTGLAADHAHVFLFDHGRFLFMLRMVDDALRDMPGEPLWRVMSNRPEPLSQLVQAEQAGVPIWESEFHVSHRIVDMMAFDDVYFAGDAAHLHSPIGARGMNLGVEDAWVFSELVRTNRMAEYDALRRPVDRQVVRRVELLTRMIAAQSPFSRVARQIALPVAVKTPILRGRMLAAVTGLDHELPDLSHPAKTDQ